MPNDVYVINICLKFLDGREYIYIYGWLLDSNVLVRDDIYVILYV